MNLKFHTIVLMTTIIGFKTINAQDNNTTNPNLNCVEATDKDGNITSKGCFILETDKSWTKHGTWLHFDKNQQVIDSINYSHGLYAGIRKTYDSKRNLTEEINYGNAEFPRIIKHTEFFYKGATKEITTSYKQFNNDSIIKHGVLLSKWKNGNIKDSVVYENGIKKYWAGYYKSGELQFTSDFGENPKKGSIIKTTEYDKDGSIRSTRTEHAGYDISLY